VVSQQSPERGGHSRGRQDRPRSQLRTKLKDSESRLRQLVASYELDPETIEYDSLDIVTEVIKRIYRALRKDAEAQNGILVQMPAIWDSLREGYQEVFAATSKLRPILKRFKDLELESRSAPAELDEATGRMVDRRQEWLIKVAEFQQAFSAFYEELVPGGEKST
jgi:hypothetical protein